MDDLSAYPRQGWRWWVLVIMLAAGLWGVVIDQNGRLLWVVLCAAVYLSARLIPVKAAHARQRFLGRLGLAAVVLMVVVGGFNYVVNPFGLYPSHVFEPIVLTTRDLKMNLYAAYRPPPQAVILGSSRSFTIDPHQIEQLWGYTTFNSSVTDGNMQDYLALLRYMAAAGKLPQLLIINVGAETFSVVDNRALEPDSRLWNYLDHSDSLYYLKSQFDRFTRLFSKDQLETSVRVVRAAGAERPPANYTFEADGMGHFNTTNLGESALKPENLASGFWGTFFKDYDADAYTFSYLQQILDVAKQQHVLVIGYMPPFLPVLHDYLLTQTDFTPALNAVTRQMDVFEGEYPFHYINFIDSEALAKGDDLYYDIVHPTEKASSLMMQQLYDQFHSFAQP